MSKEKEIKRCLTCKHRTTHKTEFPCLECKRIPDFHLKKDYWEKG